jgi:precorrin-3B C17-methyltransferase
MIYVIGLGPGAEDQLTPRALEALEKCDVIIGYKTYIDLIAPRFQNCKQLISSPMRDETGRCAEALRLSQSGKTVGLVSSGDPGVYGMAGIMLETAAGHDDVQIVPGVTAACAAAAVLGAPLTNDFAVISLSNLLTPWETIEQRLEGAAAADFVICLYNPMSRGRPDNLRRACEILLKHKPDSTPAGWVRCAGRPGQEAHLTTLGALKDQKLDMFCTVIIGSSSTRIIADEMVTPRGYLQK